ncbi:MAG: hypothetical protein A3C80_01320 [Candidatus Ryanbacteria bacterium RIFCSPHIGHO2_02_FULL_45_43]|uniref:Transcription regulator TrmB N-terminal domain-containing protein n=1 Tax=Candidatus Ryanbacteria bacterium RIFCSPHIGHO2_01_45_13 TaxID=1802112 RepID=A0A1G2G1X9_9BACT|nr:MAG: hypothetical protein A2718_04225 [Candidatus Ryanbacteria bacterium RIFCSPHIGHO2_01_FULL_44_130]OGZ44097.1 MAG: hypothetical protein A2W41_00105 [Candidatus Ryanbacteria bacterium RIFCSPHIGHO2_01_45_13]OGZ48898.1 MAG: hypothetical protein A3C80_01320 [Candidatus Ryanbacteria bacterium RIFCSPHIGHO2_02_FULL_45_43]OGZ50943.1 MAG: hypothetical protein A3E55_02855 [Candidatus Ryanbacteria bacterium RIFCSPHIGHO2_12_FULL_44_20]OGZ51779.1 MAG: hypothetical protein A3A17_02260 [Candidatus Ryanba
MELGQELKKAGLNSSEITVYLFLLTKGFTSPPEIARGTGIARTNCYNVLKSLEGKNLVERQIQGKRHVYLSTDPQALVGILERRARALSSALPDLRALHKVSKNKPSIRFFDGFEQLKELYYTTASADEIVAIGSTKKLAEASTDFFEEYQKKLKKNSVVFRDILSYVSKDAIPITRGILGGLYEYRLLPEARGEIPTDILIWDDNVALISLDQPIFGTMITSPSLALTFRVVFNIIWNALPQNHSGNL